MPRPLPSLVFLLPMLLVACEGGDVNSDGGDSAGSSGSTVTSTVQIRDFATSEALAGVELCIEASEIACMESDSAGYVYAEVPGDTRITYTWSADGYLTTVFRDHTPDEDYALFFLHVSNMLTELVLQAAGLVQEPGMGMVNAFIGVEGATVAMSGGQQVYFASPLGLIDPSLTATSSLGYALFVNVDPGEYTMTAEDANGDGCPVGLGWDRGTSFAELGVVADQFSGVTFDCGE